MTTRHTRRATRGRRVGKRRRGDNRPATVLAGLLWSLCAAAVFVAVLVPRNLYACDNGIGPWPCPSFTGCCPTPGGPFGPPSGGGGGGGSGGGGGTIFGWAGGTSSAGGSCTSGSCGGPIYHRPGSGHGSPAVSVSERSQQVILDDVPMWYQPPVGPEVQIRFTYNTADDRSIDPTQHDPPSSHQEVSSWVTGRKWTMLYLSYIHEDGADCVVYLPRFSGMRLEEQSTDVYGMDDPRAHTTKLVRAGDGSLWFKIGQEEQYVFEPDPFIPNRYRMAEHYTNPLQPPTQVSYDPGDGSLSSVAAADGTVFTFGYDANDHLTSVSDPFGRSIVLTYSNDDLTGIADMAGQAFTFTYDGGTGRVTSLTRNDNRTTSFSYTTGSPWSISVTDPENKTTTYAFGGYAGGDPNTVTDPDGNVGSSTGMGHDDRVLWSEDGSGRRTSYSYNAQTLVLEEKTDGLGYVTKYATDGQGYLQQKLLLERTIDAQGQVVEETVLRKETWENTYLTDTSPVLATQVIHRVFDPATDAVLEQTTRNYTHFDNGTPADYEDDSVLLSSEIGLIDDNDTPADPNDDVAAETRWTYNGQGQLLTVQRRVGPGEDPQDFITVESYTYDANGYLTALTDALGNMITYTYNARGLLDTKTEPGSRVTLYTYDDLNRLTGITHPDSSTESWTYGCCGVESYTDRTGGTTTYSRQDGKLLSETYETPGAQSIKDDSYTYDARGRLTKVTDALGYETTHAYDHADRRISTTDAAGSTATYRYDAVGRLSETTDPLGRVTGTEYDAAGGPAARTAFIDGEKTTLSSSTYDPAGRLLTSTDAEGNTTGYAYDQLGRLTQTTRPDGTVVTTTYDLLGNRLTETAPHQPGAPNPPTTTYTYDDLNRVVTVTNPAGQITTYEYHADFPDQITAIRRQASEQDPQTTVYSATYDADGRKASEMRDGVTLQFTYTADGRPLRTTYPDSSYTENAHDGRLLTTVRERAGNVTTFAYDALGRRTTVTNARGKTTTTSYRANTSQPATVTDPLGNATTFEYDAAGRRVRVIHPGTEPKSQRTTTTSYDDLNRVAAVDGAKTYPLAYEHDLNGRMTALIDGEGSRTEWTYDVLGRLTQKTYADGTDYDYTYGDEGRLASRTDAKGLTTTYTHDALGRLTTVDYPNDTDIVTTHDDLGRRVSRTDTTGLWTWSYDDDSSRVLTVTDPDANVTTYSYDSSGQRAGMTLTVDGADVMDLDYTNTNGRLTQIDSETNVGGDLRAAIFSYSYLANSSLLESLTSNNATDDILTTTRTYDDADRLLSVANNVGGAVPAAVSSFTYLLDAQGRRTRRTDLDGSHIDYTYNQRDELTGAVRSGYPADKPYGDYPYDYQYDFDRIGNHLEQIKNGTAIRGRYNDLNQLLEREVTGPVRVQGTADGVLPIGVKVDGGAAATADTDADTTAFRGDSSPIQPGQTGDKAISIVATDSAVPPKKTESTRTVQLPAANPVAFTYDLNGNMLTDGQWTYTWNDENRLVAIESSAGVPPADRLRLEFTYDGQGRRRTKHVYTWDTQAEDWTLTREHVFLYDDWNLIHEITTDHTQAPAEETTKSYVWGLDLSQTLQGAGGVGGLLSITRHSTPDTCHFPAYDGNGNMVALVDSSDAAVAAEYDYSPFGTTVKATGSSAEGNVWRFSTKYHDTETALVYYGQRYYSPGLASWLCTDPLRDIASTASFPSFSLEARDPVVQMQRIPALLGVWLEVIGLPVDETERLVEEAQRTLSLQLPSALGPYTPACLDCLRNVYAYVDNDPIGRIDPIGLKKKMTREELVNKAKASWEAAKYACPGSEFTAVLEIFDGCRSLGLANAWAIVQYRDCVMAKSLDHPTCKDWLKKQKILQDTWDKLCTGKGKK